MLKKETFIEFVSKRDGYIKRSVASIEKLKQLEFNVSYDIVSGLKKLLSIKIGG